MNNPLNSDKFLTLLIVGCFIAVICFLGYRAASSDSDCRKLGGAYLSRENLCVDLKALTIKK